MLPGQDTSQDVAAGPVGERVEQGVRPVVDETARRRDAWVEGALAEITPDEREILAKAAAIMQGMVAR